MSKVMLLGTAALLLAANEPALAGESGAGLYVPGSTAFGAGVTPPHGLYFTQGFLYYDGHAAASLEGGTLDLNAQKTAAPFIANLLWVPDREVLDGRLGLSVSLPYASYTRLRAGSNALGQNVETSGWGLGDISLKAQLGWSNENNFSNTVSATVWLPTGRYDSGFAPNAGKNHYGVNVSWGFTKIWKDPGIELSASFGLTGEFENTATDYRNGLGLNAEAAVGKVFDNGLTLGAAGFIFKQITDDKGSGATLGAFRGQDFGAGPALSYSTLIGGRPFSFAIRHYWEFDVENRFDGQITTAAITTRF
ncbi:transporter [Mesorhizobium sp. VK25A]|uniref:Transporter n=1 Tax=Mesorhizobium vachelliae TaxID=3072309 RepID=A0ABU5A2G5_9HYPH|nr:MULTISPECIES: transporter [unclassified Mesorhizobium]MDX8530832.1 transporter [Mesorhizobium sp. VK25D]MDX8543417.1 transporter [Mesorhizobium sp. VK25A]